MAAGLGFKTFTTGEVLTAADTNGYLMQGVLVFASAAARDAAITSPQEGQCCYLKDTDAVLTYSGSAWVGFDDSNAIQNSIVDAKGDIVAASAADTPARLAVGTNEAYLKADSTAATGLKWDYDSWTAYTPTIAPVSGSFTTASATGRYKQIGKTIFVQVKGTITTVGTGSSVTITAPFTAANQGQTYTGAGRNLQTGDGLQCELQANSNLIRPFTYANGNCAASGNILACNITYEIA